MEPIIYQGQELQAQLVNFISGSYTTSTVDNDGDEDLFRDKESPLGAIRLVGIVSIRGDVYCFDPTRFRKLEEVRAENARTKQNHRKGAR